MSLSVVIPYRFASDHRERLFQFVQNRWKRQFPHAEIVLGLNEDEQFSRSRAINDGALKATGDLLAIADADTICNTEFLRAAIQMITEGCPWVFPYRVYYNSGQALTESILRLKRADSDVQRPITSECEFIIPSLSGIIFVPRDSFLSIGGFDERFRGWGYEDDAFVQIADTLLGRHQTVPGGWVVHLWHEASESVRFQQPFIQYNRSRHQQLVRASGNPEAMRELVEWRRFQ